MKTKPKSRIHFVITGGTIDSGYDGAKDTVVPLKKSVIPAFLGTIRPSDEFVFEQVCMKDSRQLKPADMEKILAIVKNSSHRYIVITHGTYTMPDTARFLKAKLGKTGKTIFLTGSMIPIYGFAPSDGTFNLGFVLGKIEHSEPGVYVAMNGRVFSPEEVLKSLYGGRFSSIFGERWTLDLSKRNPPAGISPRGRFFFPKSYLLEVISFISKLPFHRLLQSFS